MSAGKKIARWRATLGLKERGAAELVGVSQPTLRAVERDEIKRIGLDVAMAFVRATDGAVTIDDFLMKKAKRRAA
jgi:transcriptional regulator with XRE-family HTH domain